MAEQTPKTQPGLLAGGNPQIPKGDGDGPVQAYIGAMPGWKGDVGRRLDALIVRAVPGVRKAVRWNTPFYGVEGQGWFLGFHCYARYVKVTFLRGASLDPLPWIRSRLEHVRILEFRDTASVRAEQAADADRHRRWAPSAPRPRGPGWPRTGPGNRGARSRTVAAGSG